MTHNQIIKTAEEYAEARFPLLLDSISSKPWPDVKAFLAQAYKDGADFALANQWISVDDQLPEIDSDVLVFVPAYFAYTYRYEVARFDGEDWYTTVGEHVRPSRWCPIPQIQLGTESE